MSGEHGYPANVSRTDQEGDSQEARLHVEEHCLRAVFGDESVEVPYDGLDLSITGGKNPVVVFTGPGRTDWVIEVPGHAILGDRELRRRTAIRHQIEDFAERCEGGRRLVSTVLFFAGFIGLSALAGWLVEASLPSLVAQVPASYELELGHEIAGDVREVMEMHPDTNTVAALTRMLERFHPPTNHGEYRFEISLVDDPMANAFALPGGKIFVFTGLLADAKAPEEIAGVLAHEVAHVTRRHGLRTLIANAGPSLVLDRVLGNHGGFLGALAAGSQALIQQNFSREFEREADDAAFNYLVKANIDPRGLATFLGRLAKQKGGVSRAFNSHPPSPERIAHLEKRWNALKRKDGFAKLAPIKFEAPNRGLNLDKILGL